MFSLQCYVDIYNKQDSQINIIEAKATTTNKFMSLKYKGKSRQPVITTLKRVSKPGLRVYSGSKNLPQVLGNLGIAIVSTSNGVMTNLKAKELGIGGEILCYIW